MPPTTCEKLPPALVRYTSGRFQKAIESLAYQGNFASRLTFPPPKLIILDVALIQVAEEDEDATSASSIHQTDYRARGRCAESTPSTRPSSTSTSALAESASQDSAAEATPSSSSLRQLSIAEFLAKTDKDLKLPPKDLHLDGPFMPGMNHSTNDDIHAESVRPKASTSLLNPRACSFAPMKAQANSLDRAPAHAVIDLHAVNLKFQPLPSTSADGVQETMRQHDGAERDLADALNKEMDAEETLNDIVTAAIKQSSRAHSAAHLPQQQPHSETLFGTEPQEIDAVKDTSHTLLSEHTKLDENKSSQSDMRSLSVDSPVNKEQAPLPSEGQSMADRLTIGFDGKPEREVYHRSTLCRRWSVDRYYDEDKEYDSSDS
ncbi:hypothetical protein BU16DRAFT_596950 [Lophium mytilinum]|uniref:Uncharacterized protein n=1 Tax=Lophium mytilinum TaxID=390894 RepID=A0A6A6QEW1_9PEZI|nr:hypothetical protein BU16DRAFT_596950 [Lophium mytilinum]